MRTLLGVIAVARSIGLALLLLFLLVVVANAEAHAQYGPATHFGAMTDEAKHFLDSLADVSRRTRREQAACLQSYWVENDTLTLVHFKPPYAFASDSVSVRPLGPELCPFRYPVLHTHVARFQEESGGKITVRPASLSYSTDDLLATFRHGTWALLLTVNDSTWSLSAFP